MKEIIHTLRELGEQIKAMEETIKAQRLDTRRYNKLRGLEIVIMSDDGAKYLKGTDLDKYLDRLVQHRTRADILDEALATINKAFATEYSKHASNTRSKSQETDTKDTR
jgi:hypothetical protein